MGGTIQSRLEVINNTNQDIVNTSVYSCDNYDWRGNARPDRNFNGHRITSRGGSVTQDANLRKRAKHCPFNMKLTFSDGTVDEFRIHQKYVAGCCDGFNHMKRCHDIKFDRVWKSKLIIKVSNTASQIQNQKAEERNKEGEALMKQQKYEASMQKFDEALRLSNQGSTTNSIKHNKSKACNEFGKKCFQTACELEADTKKDMSQEAKSKFDQSKNLFQQAFNMSKLSEHEQNVKMATLKIKGNSLFNEANELEQVAFKLYDSGKSDNTVAQNKYREALAKYEEAIKNFEEGVRINQAGFGDSLKIANEYIDAVNKVISDINHAELSHNVGKMNVGDEKEDKKADEQDVNVNLVQQIDTN